MRSCSRETFVPFEESLKKEWLAVNGLGGYAALSVTGARSRYYHGLLVAALTPPVTRLVLLAELREEVLAAGSRQPLWCSRYRKADRIGGLAVLHSLSLNPVPVYRYLLGGAFLSKTILPVYGKNAVQVSYHWEGETPLVLEVTPLCTWRDFHGLERKFRPELAFSPRGRGFLATQPAAGAFSVEADCGEFSLFPEVRYETGLSYLKEQERGFRGLEDLAVPGQFLLTLNPGERVTITACCAGESVPGFAEALAAEERRQAAIVAAAGTSDPDIRRLALAADKFLVRRASTGTWSLLAGFPWFSDWGRDTMISLPGLALATGRHEVARELLLTFAASEQDGLLPNRFSDYAGDHAEYNTVDASLWFFVGVLQYLEATGDEAAVREHFFPVMERILERHSAGTRFNIKVDPADGLLAAGEAGVQLTWMDAKVDGHVITPRHGKPVEINALWYNALRIRDLLAGRLGLAPAAHAETAARVLASFRTAFWNEEAGCLYDVITGGRKDAAIRPNQLFAVCLPFPLLEREAARRVVDTVTTHLLTPYGLRSLSPGDPQFRPVFSGDRWSRDSAYHQGTVWSWLIGPYAFSLFAVRGDSAELRAHVRALLAPLLNHLDSDGLDCISENFDGFFPAEGKGCFHQAWSVAELLRILVFLHTER